MSIGFVIMQIGDASLDSVCDTVIFPAVREAGLDPRRVDRHNAGELLKSEIIRFINEAAVIVADLTNERPNVYLEVGYAMGIDKFRQLILTCRKDHLPGNPDWAPDGPKVHFDLAGYDILFWDPDDLESFRLELTKRISRRRALTASSEETKVPVLDPTWIETQRDRALPGLRENAFEAFFEVAFGLEVKASASPKELLEAASAAQIETFGWPIGVVLHSEESKPRPRADGIVAEVTSTVWGPSYDYWALRRNGDFYSLMSLFEDKRDPGAIFFNTRIVRCTETLMYALRLYERLGVERDTVLHMQTRYGGFAGRHLSAVGNRRELLRPASSQEHEFTTKYSGSLASTERNLSEAVKALTAPFFALFDFHEFADSVYENIVSEFVKGNVT